MAPNTATSRDGSASSTRVTGSPLTRRDCSAGVSLTYRLSVSGKSEGGRAAVCLPAAPLVAHASAASTTVAIGSRYEAVMRRDPGPTGYASTVAGSRHSFGRYFTGLVAYGLPPSAFEISVIARCAR